MSKSISLYCGEKDAVFYLYAAACKSVVASGSSFPHLRLSRVVVSPSVLQRFVARRCEGRAGQSLPHAGRTETTQRDPLESFSLIISYCLSKLAKSCVKRLRHQHFQLESRVRVGRVGVTHEDSTQNIVTPNQCDSDLEEEDEGESPPEGESPVDQGEEKVDEIEGEDLEKSSTEEPSSSQPTPELEVWSTIVD